MDKIARPDQLEDHDIRRRVVRLRKGEVKPADAHIMTNQEVLTMQQQTIMKWKPRSEMWPFSWGLGILGGTAALSGALLGHFCRSKLGLLNIARAGAYFPTVGLPILCSSLVHNFAVTNKILVGEFPCTVCAATRSGSIQAAAAVLYPSVLAPLIGIITARNYHTEYVPGVRDIEFLRFLRKLIPGAGTMFALLLVNFGLGMVIAEREAFLFNRHLSPTSSSVKEEEEEFFQ